MTGSNLRIPAPALFSLIIGAAAGFWACSGGGSGAPSGFLQAAEDLRARSPDAQTANARAWYVERTPALGVYLMELRGSQPLERLGGELRILVISGRLRLRVGPNERVLEAGGYAAVPATVPYRLVRVGKERLLYLAFLSPDSPHRKTIESPGLMRHLEGSS